MFKPTRHILNDHFEEGLLDKEYYIDALDTKFLPFDTISQIEKKQAALGESESMEAVAGLLNFVLPKVVAGWNLEDSTGAVLPLPTKENPGTWRALPTQVVLVIMEMLLTEKESDKKEEGGESSNGLIPLRNDRPSSPRSLQEEAKSPTQETQAVPV